MQFFPEGKSNLVIVVPAPSDRHNPGVYITDSIPDFHLEGVGVQCFPLYDYSGDAHDGLFASFDSGPYAVSADACMEFSKHYGFEIDGEALFYYTYGILSSMEYQEVFRSDLKKELPHIPFAADFRAFESAGRKLASLVVGYESLQEFEGVVHSTGSPAMSVEKIALTRQDDGLAIALNPKVQISGLPASALDYKVFGRSPLEWVVSRFQKKTDKASGITNDPNLWAEEHDDPDYIKKLVGKVVTLGIEAEKVISTMPKLGIKE
jgi:predicted helicase